MSLETPLIDFFSQKLRKHPSTKDIDRLKELTSEYFDIPCETLILTNDREGGISLVNRILYPKKIGTILPSDKLYYFLSSPLVKKVTVGNYDFSNNRYNIETGSSTNILWINIPHSPISYIPTIEELDALMLHANNVAIDMTFITYLPNRIRKKYIDYFINTENSFLIFSFSKEFLMPGLRIGIIYSNYKKFNILWKFSEPHPVSTYSLERTIKILESKKTLKKIEKTKKHILNLSYKISSIFRKNDYYVYGGFSPYILINGSMDKIASLWLKFNTIGIDLEIPGKSEFEGLDSTFLKIPITGKELYYKIKEVLKND